MAIMAHLGLGDHEFAHGGEWLGFIFYALAVSGLGVAAIGYVWAVIGFRRQEVEIASQSITFIMVLAIAAAIVTSNIMLLTEESKK